MLVFEGTAVYCTVPSAVTLDPAGAPCFEMLHRGQGIHYYPSRPTISAEPCTRLARVTEHHIDHTTRKTFGFIRVLIGSASNFSTAVL